MLKCWYCSSMRLSDCYLYNSMRVALLQRTLELGSRQYRKKHCVCWRLLISFSILKNWRTWQFEILFMFNSDRASVKILACKHVCIFLLLLHRWFTSYSAHAHLQVLHENAKNWMRNQTTATKRVRFMHVGKTQKCWSGSLNLIRYFERSPLLSKLMCWQDVEFDCIGSLIIAFSSTLLCSVFAWASSWQNQRNGMYARRRLRSAWAFAQSDQSIRGAL